MFNALVSQIAARYEAGETLHSILNSELQNIHGTESFDQAMGRMNASTLFPDETARLHAGESYVLLGESGGWSISLSSYRGTGKLAYSSAYPFAVAIVGGAGPEMVDVFEAPGVKTAAPPEAAGLRLDGKRRVVMRFGDVLEIDGDNEIYHLAVHSPSTIWLRVTGPPQAAYTHSYRVDDGGYSYSTFSDHIYTGNDFLARLLKEFGLSEPFDSDAATSCDRRNFVTLADLVLEDSKTAASSRWSIIQALGVVDPDRALALLQALAAEDEELSPVAREALSTMDATDG